MRADAENVGRVERLGLPPDCWRLLQKPAAVGSRAGVVISDRVRCFVIIVTDCRFFKMKRVSIGG
jgi:hypothetical protein